MQNLEKITNLNDLNPNDIILLIDLDGKIGGWDQINYIGKDFSYDYKPLYNCMGNNYQGNLRKMQDRYSIFLVKDKGMVNKYNDSKLDSEWISFSQGYIFEEVLFDEVHGSLIKTLLWKLIKKDFSVRMKFLDLCETHSGMMRELTFQDTRSNISESGILKLKNDILGLINKLG